MYIEFTLANSGSVICFPVGYFHFTAHPEGGTNIHVGGITTYHVDMAYEDVIDVLHSHSLPVFRAEEEEE